MSSGLPLPTELAFAPKFSRDGKQLALVLNGAAAPSDVWVLDLASRRFHQVTHSPHTGINLDNLVRPQLVHYSANDGLPLSAWLWLPKHWSPPGPVVLSFHGGPEGEELPGFRSDYHALLIEGIAVLAPNVRGSSGFGKRFVNLDNGKLRFNAIKDIKSSAKRLVGKVYGAGQDLLVSAPSGNVRGAGPAVAEIEFVRDPNSKDRPVEAVLVFAADKCGPGAYNFPLYTVFCDPMHNSGLLLNPKMHLGFTLTIIDMDHKSKDGDRVIQLQVPERIWDAACLLQNPDRFAIEAIHSRYKPEEQIVSVSATRLHNIAGKYTGKDDPVAIVRTQGLFPAPEEIVEPYLLGHFVTGDCRGSHVMPLMPVAINTPVAGPFCLPLVSCLGFSIDAEGLFTREACGSVWQRGLGRDANKGPAKGRRVAAARLRRCDHGVAC